MGRAFVSSQPGSGYYDIFPPDLFIVSPERELLGRLAYDATAEETYTFLLDILGKRPDLAPHEEQGAIMPAPSDPAEAALAELEARYNSTTPGRDWWKSSMPLLFRVEGADARQGFGFDAVKASLVEELEGWLRAHAERLPNVAALARVLLGGARIHAGDFVGAREAWQSVIALHPDHPLRHRAAYNLIEPGAFGLAHPELARLPRAPVAQVGVYVPEPALRAQNMKAVRADPRYLHDVIPGLPCVRVEAGIFTMGGSPAVQARELPTRRVTISKPFLISAWPITRALWRRFRPGDYPGTEHEGLAGELPAVRLAWPDLFDFCEFTSKEIGRRVRLPTEAEWEYAARGGLAEKQYPWGDEPPHGRCNFAHTRPIPVGCFLPNGYGLFDCVGNNFEWVADYYLKDAYRMTPAEVTDPLGPELDALQAAGGGVNRVVRGCGWLGSEVCSIHCRNSWRLGWPENYRWCNLGGRVVIEL